MRGEYQKWRDKNLQIFSKRFISNRGSQHFVFGEPKKHSLILKGKNTDPIYQKVTARDPKVDRNLPVEEH